MPKAQDDIDVYNDETWFHVADNDVFPEEFPRFMALRKEYVAVLEETHGELFDAAWWQDVQRRIASGEALDVPPYGPEARLG
jgi:isocitrate dehydrogenase kinase/phosphatase